jgi:membrane associated rhomboid family serine protease
VKRRSRIDWGQVRITRGALVLAGLEVGLSLIWLLADGSARGGIAKWLVASPSQVFERARVWTLATSVFLQPEFLNLLLHVLVLWMFVPTLERFWGTSRFYRFVVITSLAGSLVGCLAGLATGRDVAITGLSPFVNAAIVAFGVVYARQPVQFFGVLPLSGRQLMWGFIGFDALFVVLQGMWEQGAAWAAAMIAAALLTSKQWNPGLAWKRWRIARARARLSVLEGGAPKKPKRDEHRYLN